MEDEAELLRLQKALEYIHDRYWPVEKQKAEAVKQVTENIKALETKLLSSNG